MNRKGKPLRVVSSCYFFGEGTHVETGGTVGAEGGDREAVATVLFIKYLPICTNIIATKIIADRFAEFGNRWEGINF